MSTIKNAKHMNDKANAERETVDLPNFDFLGSIDITKMAIKVAIGYAYLIVGYIAVEHVAVTLALLVSPLWLQLVIAFFALATGLVAIIYTAPLVSNTLFDAGAFAVKHVKNAFGFAKEKFTNLRPSVTVH